VGSIGIGTKARSVAIQPHTSPTTAAMGAASLWPPISVGNGLQYQP